jgi:hypothetical protein
MFVVDVIRQVAKAVSLDISKSKFSSTIGNLSFAANARKLAEHALTMQNFVKHAQIITSSRQGQTNANLNIPILLLSPSYSEF